MTITVTILSGVDKHASAGLDGQPSDIVFQTTVLNKSALVRAIENGFPFEGILATHALLHNVHPYSIVSCNLSAHIIVILLLLYLKNQLLSPNSANSSNSAQKSIFPSVRDFPFRRGLGVAVFGKVFARSRRVCLMTSSA